jgi:hypothetical protein
MAFNSFPIDTADSALSGAAMVAAIQKSHEIPASAVVNEMLSSGKVLGANNLFNFYDQVLKFDYGNAFAGITGYGDSMAVTNGYVLGAMTRALQTRYGTGAVTTPKFGQAAIGASWTLTGGAAQPVTDFTYLPSACQITMPAGSTAQTTTTFLGYDGSSLLDGQFPDEINQRDTVELTTGFTSVRCFYLTRPSDGELTFTLSQSFTDSYTPVVVNCNAALNILYVDIPVLNAAQELTILVESANAGCIYIGSVMYRDKGIISLGSQVGGSTMTQQNLYIDSGNLFLYKKLCEDLGIRLFIHTQRAGGDTAYQANYVKVFDAIDTIDLSCSLVLGEAPAVDNTFTPNIETINDYLLNQSIVRKYAYFDQNKAVGSSYANLVALGWEGDGTHLSGKAHRYFAGLILEGVNYFRLAANRIDIDPMTIAKFLDKFVDIVSIINTRSSIISARAETTMDGLVSSGGFAYAPSNQRGFRLNGSTSLGAVAGLCGEIVVGRNAETSNTNISTVISGHRNLSLTSGVRALLLVGVFTAFPSMASINQKCFGFECALGSDVGSPGGITTEVIRIVASNGTTVSYGSWVNAIAGGAGGTDNDGLLITIGFNRVNGSLELYRASSGARNLASSKYYPFLLTNDCSGGAVSMALIAEDAGNVPTGASNFSANYIKTTISANSNGLQNNGY